MTANNNPGPVTVLQSIQPFSLLALDILKQLIGIVTIMDMIKTRDTGTWC